MPPKPPPQPPFDDCLGLVKRADVHLKALHRSLGTFRKSGAYSVTAHIDPDTALKGDAAMHIGYPPGGPENAPIVLWAGDKLTEAGYIPIGDPLPHPRFPDTREIVLTGHVARQPPARRLGTVIGDVVNNLRAALDHAVWHLSTKGNMPPDPIPRKGPGSEWRQVGWPIILDRANWKVGASPKLRFVEPGIWAGFEALQPFDRRQHQPEIDEFAVLDELWNIYKHRHLPLVESWVGVEKVFSTAAEKMALLGVPDPELAKHSFTILSEASFGPFKDGAELGRVREAPHARGRINVWQPHMNVNASLAVDIAFDAASPTGAVLVEGALQGIRDEVEAALETLRPHF